MPIDCLAKDPHIDTQIRSRATAFLQDLTNQSSLSRKKRHALAINPSPAIKTLKQCQLLFLLDGYDKIKGDHNNAQRRLANTLIEKWSHAHVLITCRSTFLTMAHHKKLLSQAKKGGRFDYVSLQQPYLTPFTAA